MLRVYLKMLLYPGFLIGKHDNCLTRSNVEIVLKIIVGDEELDYNIAKHEKHIKSVIARTNYYLRTAKIVSFSMMYAHELFADLLMLSIQQCRCNCSNLIIVDWDQPGERRRWSHFVEY